MNYHNKYNKDLNKENEKNFTLPQNNDTMKLQKGVTKLGNTIKKNSPEIKTTDSYNTETKPKVNEPAQSLSSSINSLIPKEKKEQERLQRATGTYDLKNADLREVSKHLKLKEKTPDDYYSMSVPPKELNRRLDNEALGPKTDFSIWNFENNYDKLNKEEQSMLVHKMQLDLNNQGYRDYDGYSLKPDGIFGDKTKSVYEQYKKDKKDELEDYEPDDKKIVEGEDYQVLKNEDGKPVLLASTDMGLSGLNYQGVYDNDLREPEDKQLDFEDQKKIDALIYTHNLTNNIEEKEAYRRAITQIRKQDKYKNIYKNSENGIYKDDYNYTSQANLTALVNIMSEGMAWLEGGENFWNDFSFDIIKEFKKSKSLKFFDKLLSIIKYMDYDYYSKAENLKEGDIIVTLNGAYSDSSLGSANKKNFYRDKRGSLYRILYSE